MEGGIRGEVWKVVVAFFVPEIFSISRIFDEFLEYLFGNLSWFWYLFYVSEVIIFEILASESA